MLHVALIAALLAGSAPSETAKADASAKPVAKVDPDKKVCRRLVPTGSIMSEKTCRSQREWDELSASGQDVLKQTRQHSDATMGQPSD